LCDFDSALKFYAAVNRFGMQNIALLSSVDNLSVGKLRVKVFKSFGDNNIQ
jgi:LacI family transcriptional regulator